MARRYSPAGRFSIWYLPALSESTLTVIFVLALRAWTKAPRNAAPSGPVTEPLMLAASATVLERANEARVASASFAAGRMAFPHVCCGGASLRMRAPRVAVKITRALCRVPDTGLTRPHAEERAQRASRSMIGVPKNSRCEFLGAPAAPILRVARPHGEVPPSPFETRCFATLLRVRAASNHARSSG